MRGLPPYGETCTAAFPRLSAFRSPVFCLFLLPSGKMVGGFVKGHFPAVVLLEQFPFLRLYPVKLLSDRLILAVLFPHLAALGEGGNPTLGLDDLAPQVIILGVHLYQLFVKLLHGLNPVGLQKAEQGSVLLQGPDSAAAGDGLP